MTSTDRTPRAGRAAGFLVLLLGLAALAVAGWWLSTDPEAPEQGPGRPPYMLPATLAPVEVRDVRPVVELTGSLRSVREASVGFETSGRLVAVLAREADRVEKGVELARLDTRDAELALVESRADLTLAERELEKLEAGERGEVVKRLEAELEIARAEEELARLEIERGRNLVAEEVISEAEQDRRVAQHAAAQGRVAVAQERLSEARTGTRAEDLEIARARVAVAQASVESARRELDKCTLRAPWDGAVVERLAAEGDFLTSSEPLFELVDLETLEVELEIPAQHALRLPDDPHVVLRLDEAPGVEIDARLDAQVPRADQRSRAFVGLVRLRNEDAPLPLRPGMFVRARLDLAPARDALAVPLDALRRTDAGPIVVRAVEEPAAVPGNGGPGSGPQSGPESGPESGPGAGGGPPGGPPGGGPRLVGEWVPVRVLARDETHAAVELAPGADVDPLAAGQQVVVTGVDLAFPGVALLPVGPPPAPPGAEAGATDAEERP